jgi:hypothetical protein
MKNALRLCGLAALVSLASLSQAHASGTCRIMCYTGMTYQYIATDGNSCCQQISRLCPGGGRGSYNGFACLIPP